RPLQYGGRDCAMYFVDGFVKDGILNRIMNHLSQLSPQVFQTNAIQNLIKKEIAYIEVETHEKLGDIVRTVLSGPIVLLIDGEKTAIAIDARTYPARGPGEPDIERVVRGSR